MINIDCIIVIVFLLLLINIVMAFFLNRKINKLKRILFNTEILVNGEWIKLGEYLNSKNN